MGFQIGEDGAEYEGEIELELIANDEDSSAEEVERIEGLSSTLNGCADATEDLADSEPAHEAQQVAEPAPSTYAPSTLDVEITESAGEGLQRSAALHAQREQFEPDQLVRGEAEDELITFLARWSRRAKLGGTWALGFVPRALEAIAAFRSRSIDTRTSAERELAAERARRELEKLQAESGARFDHAREPEVVVLDPKDPPKKRQELEESS